MKCYFRPLLRQLIIAALFLSFLPAAWTAGPPAPSTLAVESAAAGAWIDRLTLSTGAVTTTIPLTAPQHDQLSDSLAAPGWFDQGPPGGQTYNLQGSLTVNRIIADPGNILTYTLVLTNGGEVSLDVTLNDRIPAWTTYVTGSVTGGATFVQDAPPANPGVGRIAWNGPLPVGSSRTIGFRVGILDTAPPGAAIVNTPQITTPQLALNLRVTTVISGGHLIYMPLLLVGD